MNLNETPMEKVKRVTKRVLRMAKRKFKNNDPTTTQFYYSPTQHSNLTPILEVVPTRATTKIIGANWLAGFHGNEHSEHGEDGIIAKIFEIMPPTNKWVCEFGAHDPEIISNTWELINRQEWNAVLIEADPGYYQKLKTYYQDKSHVHCINTKVSYEGAEKLDEILVKTPIPNDMDFMVIDIDGNDYHVWEAIERYRAKVVMIEFNASIPIDVRFTQPRDMSLSQGSSLNAMVQLASTKGYQLIAVTSWNAFFVKDEYYSLFFKEKPTLEDMYVYPARHPIWMRPFQLYDGTIMMAPWNQMLWHNINLSQEDYQVLPTSLRRFNRDLAAREYVTEKDGRKTSLADEEKDQLAKVFARPGNVMGQFAKNVFSHYGEDGILMKLLQLIAVDDRFFVDVGAGDGMTRSRSRHLSIDHVWQGLLIESDPEMVTRARKVMAEDRAILIDQPLSLTGDNSLNAIFDNHHLQQDFALLILNNFGMEYYVWESLQNYAPKIVMAQFNPTIPNDVKFVQPKNFAIHQGCSLRALCELANYKGYELVAVTIDTAFFVKRKNIYRLFETIGFKHVDLDDMYAPMKMDWFQLYDGTLVPGGVNRLLWHGIRIDEEKLQVVPKALRKFHQYAEADDKKFFYRV